MLAAIPKKFPNCGAETCILTLTCENKEKIAELYVSVINLSGDVDSILS